MPKLKTLSGKEVVDIFVVLGFGVVHQRGSHVKLKRTPSPDTIETLTVPLRNELDKGTVKAIH